MESPRLGLWCPSTSLQPQESKGMKTGMRWEWRLSSPLPNEKQLPACKQQTVWGKTEFWYHIKPENFYISCRIWIVYFSLLVLQVYNKLRIKYTFFFFFSVGLPLSSPQCLGFPQSYQVLIWKICCRQVGEKKASNMKCPLGHGGAPRERKNEREQGRMRAPGLSGLWATGRNGSRKKCGLLESETWKPACTSVLDEGTTQISLLALFAAFLTVTCGTLPKKNLELITRKKQNKTTNTSTEEFVCFLLMDKKT